MSDERLTDAHRERLLKGVEKLAELEQTLINAQRSLAEAAMCFQYEECQPETSPEPQRTSTHVVGRDSRGEMMAMASDGTILYKSSNVDSYIGPFTFWICDADGVIRKQYVDQHDEVWLK